MLRTEHSWPATAEHVGDARAEVAALAARAGAPTPVLDGVRLAVSEAVSNAIVHGYRDQPGGRVTVVAEAGERELTVVVGDDGCGLAPRPDSPGVGLGLPLMAEIADSVSMSTGPTGRGTLVRMTFALAS